MVILMNAVKITFMFTGKNRFNLFSKPINLEHLIEIFVYGYPSKGFLARIPREDYNVGLFLFRFHLFSEENCSLVYFLIYVLYTWISLRLKTVILFSRSFVLCNSIFK